MVTTNDWSPRMIPGNGTKSVLFGMATVVLVTIGSPVQSAPVLKILGFDDMSCQAWGQSKADKDQRTLYIVWIRGLLTGHNYALPGQQVSTISSGTIEQFVNRHCSEYPLDRFDEAAFRLSDQFSGRNAPITK